MDTETCITIRNERDVALETIARIKVIAENCILDATMPGQHHERTDTLDEIAEALIAAIEGP